MRGAGLALLVALSLAGLPSEASVINGGFDSGLSGWSAEGDVEVTTDASLGDQGVVYSLLFQPVALLPGVYVLEFDLFTALSADLPMDPLAFYDVFFASLYYTNDLPSFDLAGGVYDGADALLDADWEGTHNVFGTLGPSSLGPDWAHFALAFDNSHAYAIPVFELFDFNTADGDSEVRVDNVTIEPRQSVVPEPASLALVAVGLAGFAARRARARG